MANKKIENKDEESVFTALGRIIGYLHIMPISLIGCGLILFGIANGVELIHSVKSQWNDSVAHFDGPCIFAGLCILSGAILQAAKSNRK